MTVKINSGNDWIAAIDEEDHYVKFIGYISDIDHIKELIKDDKFLSLREFSLFVRALNLPLCSCCGMVD